MNTYAVVVHSTTGKLRAVSYATHAQAIASIRMFMRADGYPAAELIDEATGETVKVYLNKNRFDA